MVNNNNGDEKQKEIQIDKENNLLQEDSTNDLTNDTKKRHYYKYLIGAIASGVLLWLIYVISELVA